ncbi:hypothetical protein DRO54_06075 [Candidatus Bathyarchaeota archaeon]|nr:MAG: hypothetical protein DRO54_06075 [Candidatus Bathyarchaeota archaeon]
MGFPFGAHEAKIYYVEEAEYGVIPSNPSMMGLKAENVEPWLSPGLIKLRGVGSRDLQAIKRGLWEARLGIAYPLPSDAPINFLQHIQTLNSLTIEVIYERTDSIVDLRFTGCMLDKASVECHIEDVIKASVEVFGQKVETATSRISGATYADYSGAIAYYESFVKKGDADGSNLQVVEKATDWKFTVENNLKRIPVIRETDGHLLKYLAARHRNLYGELTLEFESKEEYDEIISDSEFSLQFGLGAGYTATFKYCKWENVSTPTRIEDLISLKAAFVAKDLTIS